ncbi:MAG: cell division protein FtsZ [Gammaproteobacteria bacterium]|nr:cell division protein FtsZ [Gammaproteobacteria bacterium]
MTMFQLVEEHKLEPNIKVIGVGGGGGNAVNHMMGDRINGVQFLCANTDAQALGESTVENTIQIGTELTKGLGAGADPEVGRQAAMDDRERLTEQLTGTDMVFITAGMGGGTGTGAAPVIAQVAKDLGVLTVAVVTLPFRFEGRKRMKYALDGIEELKQHVDSLITIPNEKLMKVLGEDVQLLEAFAEVDNILLGAVQGIAELITNPGKINVDFADVRTVMMEMGLAMMGSGEAVGPDRAIQAAKKAISSPLLEDISLKGAKGILVNITANSDIKLGEFSDVGDTIEDFAADDATVVVGTAIDPSMGETLRVTVVATGLSDNSVAEPPKVERPQMEVVPQLRKASGDYDYDALGKPMSTRGGKFGEQPAHSPRSAPDFRESGDGGNGRSPLLDIPAFLRRQAD